MIPPAEAEMGLTRVLGMKRYIKEKANHMMKKGAILSR